MEATGNSTIDRPLLISQRHATDRLITEAAHRIKIAAACPPIDPIDLFVVFVTDPETGYAQLARLGPNQIVAQAITMSSLMSELHGVDWPVEVVLSRWTSAIERRGLRKVAA